MSSKRRNLVVGIVVLGALGVLAWMVLQFANRAANFFLTRGTKVQMITDRADGLSDGSAVLYRGVNVGRVLGVGLRNTDEVLVDIVIDQGPLIPENVVGEMRTMSMLSGSASINLEPDGKPSERLLAPGATIKARPSSGGGLLPPEITGLAEDIRNRELIRHLDETVVSIREQAERAGRLMDSTNDLVSDQKMREDLRASIAQIRAVMEQAGRIATNVEKLSTQASDTMGEVQTTVTRGGRHMDELAKNLNGRVDQIGATLERFQSVATKMDKGEGTAGKLVNDPKLYEALSDTATELGEMMKDLRRLIQQWEQEGPRIRL